MRKNIRKCVVCGFDETRSPNRLLSIASLIYVPPMRSGEKNLRPSTPRLIVCENCFAHAAVGDPSSKAFRVLGMAMLEALKKAYQSATGK